MEDPAPSLSSSEPPGRGGIDVTAAGNDGRRLAANAVLFAVCLGALILYAPNQHDDTDIWFHLRYGREHLERRTFFVDHSAFSWTPASPGWIYVSWLGSSLLYLVYTALGVAGLYLLLWSIVACALLASYALMRSRGVALDPPRVLLFLVTALSLSSTAFYLKAEMFSTLFFAAVVALFFHDRARPTRFLLVLPLLFLVWANTHGAFVMGLLFLGLAVLGELAATRSATRLALVALACLLATQVNPYGLRYSAHLLETNLGDRYLGEAERNVAAYQDLVSLLGMQGRVRDGILASLGLAVAVGALMTRSYRREGRLDPTILLVNAVFLGYALLVARAILFYPLVALPSVVMLSKPRAFRQSGAGLARSGLIASAAILLIAGHMIRSQAAYSASKGWLGERLEEAAPVKETAFVREHALPGPIFNDYLSGGYLLWELYPRLKVFIDPRYTPYVSTVLPDYFRLTQATDPEALFDFAEKYPFQTAIVANRETVLLALFLTSPEWRLLYYGPFAAVIVRADVYDAFLRAHAPPDLRTDRFADVRNPAVLMRLIRLLFIHDPNAAARVLELYRRNVSPWFPGKQDELRVAEQLVAQGLSRIER